MAFESWDPRMQDFTNPIRASVNTSAPGKNFVRKNHNEPEGDALYIKNIPMQMDKESLQDYVETCGVSPLQITMMSNPRTTKMLGTFAAIVKVKSSSQGLKVIEKLNKLSPVNLDISFAKKKSPENGHKANEPKQVPVDHQPFANKFEPQSNNNMGREHKSPENIEIRPSRRSVGRGIQKNHASSLGHTPTFPAAAPSLSTVKRNLGDQLAGVTNTHTNVTQNLEQFSNGICRGYLGSHNSVDNMPAISSRPVTCVFCGGTGTTRCSVCKATYCSRVCQEDDWYTHKDKCAPPPPLEELMDTLSISSKQSKSSDIRSVTSRSSSSSVKQEVRPQKKGWPKRNTPVDVVDSRPPNSNGASSVINVAPSNGFPPRPQPNSNQRDVVKQPPVNLPKMTKPASSWEPQRPPSVSSVTSSQHSEKHEQAIILYDDCEFVSLPVAQSTDVIVRDSFTSSPIIMATPKESSALMVDLQEMSNKMQMYGNSKSASYLPSEGEMVLAKFEDGLWYRAAAIKVDSRTGEILVIYVDYGNTAHVARNELLKMDTRFMQLPLLTVSCLFLGLKTDLSDQQKDLLKELIPQDSLLTVDVRSFEDYMYTITSSSMALKLSEAGLME